MLRVLWQKSMIALARAPRLKRYVQSRGLARRLARKYVAGGTAAAAVRRAEELLRDHNLRGSLFFLGEYVDEPTLVAENVAGGIDAAQALGESGSCRQTGPWRGLWPRSRQRAVDRRLAPVRQRPAVALAAHREDDRAHARHRRGLVRTPRRTSRGMCSRCAHAANTGSASTSCPTMIGRRSRSRRRRRCCAAQAEGPTWAGRAGSRREPRHGSD
jgi:hypothetical protein